MPLNSVPFRPFLFGCATCIYGRCTPQSVGYGREYECQLAPGEKPHCPSESGKPMPEHCRYENAKPTTRGDHE